MADAPKTAPDPRAQVDKFRELARELDCDESEEAFKAKVVRVAGKRPARPKNKER